MEQVAINSEVQESIYTPVTKYWEGKEYIVVPVVMMVEGVHNGSRGPVFHSASELAQSAPKWDGMPVTISHPQINGNFVSANSDEVYSSWGVGHVSNTYMDGKKLKAEAWLDVQKLVALSPETLAAVRAGKILEVSVGVFTEETNETGVWNGEQYNTISSNHKPDHLALLPGEVGACSVMDGCGIRVNKLNKEGGEKVKNLREFVLPNEDYYVVNNMVVFAEGLRETVDKVRDSLYSKDNDTEEYYLEEVYSDSAVYRRVIYETNENGRYKRLSDKLYRQEYAINNGVVTWNGSPTEVTRKVDYININKEEKRMCEKCKEKANALITNSNTHFNETHREWLEGLTEDKLDLLIPKLVQANKEVEVTQEKALEVLGIAKEQYEKGLEIYNTRRAEVVQNIMTNTDEGVWTKEVLDTMKLDVLEKIEKTIGKKNAQGVYIGSGAEAQVNVGVAPMPLPGIEFDVK
jgi:hypothetical protein